MVQIWKWLAFGLLASVWISGVGSEVHAQTTVDTISATSAVHALTGRGIKVKNQRFKGNPQALGKFSGGLTPPAFSEGIVLSTGKASDLSGPNDRPKVSTYNERPGDKDLNLLARTRTFDMASLEFQFMTDRDSIALDLIFASEEYHEFVNSTFNDVFVIHLTGPGLGNGKNLALVPGTNLPIHINTISTQKNRRYFVNNNPFDLNGKINPTQEAQLNPALLASCQYDGMTQVISVGTRVQAKEVYRLRISIADAGDGNNDSALLLKAGSFRSLEQNKWERRRQAREAQRIADSLALADSLSAVQALTLPAEPISAAQASLSDSLAAQQNSHESKILIAYSEGDYLLSESDELLLVDLISYLQDHPEKKVGLFTPDTGQLPELRSDIVRMDLIKAGVASERIIQNGFSFLPEGHPAAGSRDRLEIWVQ